VLSSAERGLIEEWLERLATSDRQDVSASSAMPT
jgi:hypothetical protein